MQEVRDKVAPIEDKIRENCLRCFQRISVPVRRSDRIVVNGAMRSEIALNQLTWSQARRML